MINSEVEKTILLKIASVSGDMDKNGFLNQVVQIMCDYLDLYFVGLYLADFARGIAVFKAGSGEFGQKLISLNHKVPIGIRRDTGGQAGTAIGLGEIRLTSWRTGEIFGYSLPSKSPAEFIPKAKSKDELNPFYGQLLPLTNYELFLPLRMQEQIIGVLEVHSAKDDIFSLEDIMVLQGLADEIAVLIPIDG